MNLTVDFCKDKRRTMLIRAYFWAFELYCVLGFKRNLTQVCSLPSFNNKALQQQQHKEA